MLVLEAPFITIIRECLCGGAGCKGYLDNDLLIVIHNETLPLVRVKQLGRLEVVHETYNDHD
jgi:hypothetical protein